MHLFDPNPGEPRARPAAHARSPRLAAGDPHLLLPLPRPHPLCRRCGAPCCRPRPTPRPLLPLSRRRGGCATHARWPPLRGVAPFCRGRGPRGAVAAGGGGGRAVRAAARRQQEARAAAGGPSRPLRWIRPTGPRLPPPGRLCSGVEACRGLSSPPRLAPKARRGRFPPPPGALFSLSLHQVPLLALCCTGTSLPGFWGAIISGQARRPPPAPARARVRRTSSVAVLRQLLRRVRVCPPEVLHLLLVGAGALHTLLGASGTLEGGAAAQMQLQWRPSWCNGPSALCAHGARLPCGSTAPHLPG